VDEERLDAGTEGKVRSIRPIANRGNVWLNIGWAQILAGYATSVEEDHGGQLERPARLHGDACAARRRAEYCQVPGV